MVRPKPDGAVRIILNLSAPKGSSVNDGIDSALFPAAMSSTEQWLGVLERTGRKCLIMKMDWSDAYKHIPVREADLDLQWFSWLGRYFVELCLIFGAASSVGIYDRAAKAVLDIVLRVSKFPRQQVCQHLDDVCAAAPEGSVQLAVFEKAYRDVASQIGVKLAPTDDPEKAFSPCTSGTVLGVTYNTETWSWCIPEAKLARVIVQIEEAMSRENLRQDEMWSLAGRILHYAPLIPTGRFNLDYIIRANSESKEKSHLVELNPQLRRQLYFWWLILRVTSGWSPIPCRLGLPAWARDCYSDAAGGTMEALGRGVGVVSEDWWVYVPWGKKINCGMRAQDGKKLSRKLSALELVGPLLCVTAGAAWCRGRPVRVWVDNVGSVTIWKKGYSTRCVLCTTLVKATATVAAAIGCRLDVQKIRRCSTAGAAMADSLSKADFNGFRRTGLQYKWPLAVAPASVPPPLLRWLANPVGDDDLGSVLVAEVKKCVPVLEVL
jgi:hypothetical protein